MTTVAEILDAAARLDSTEKEDLIQKLKVQLANSRAPQKASDPYDLPPDFTERLTDAFNEARRAAIQRGTK